MACVVQTYNKEKEVIEEEFKAFQQDLKILEARICTKMMRIQGEVSGIGDQMMVQ
jgi:hypothetical protein